ncbi:MAG: MBL fold metallo-hydrolase [Bacteroidales bacterium]|nr:MBL fold metallo-hydrolase [Bacteroidales bacterium]
MKKILIALGIGIAALIIFAAGYFLVMRHEMKQMATVETGKITDQVYAIKDSYVNVYAVGSDSGYIMIDAGNNSETIEAGLVGLNIDPAKVKAIFLTHTDGDHVASIPLFPNAAVFLSRQEEQMINGATGRFLFFGNKISAKKSTLVDDGQVINLPGISIKGILSPGHTPGSMCYLVDEKYLFTGDVLSLKAGKVAAFSKFINMDTKTDRESIDKLSRLKNVSYILTAHFGVSNDFGAAFKDWHFSNADGSPTPSGLIDH